MLCIRQNFCTFRSAKTDGWKKWHRKPLSPVPEESGRCCSALNSSYYRKTEQRRESGGCQGRGPDFPPLITRKSWRVSLKLYKNELTCGRRRNERSVQLLQHSGRRGGGCRTAGHQRRVVGKMLTIEIIVNDFFSHGRKHTEKRRSCSV